MQGHIGEVDTIITTAGTVNLATPKETVEMKENVSYGPVRVHSQTATQEPVYEEPDTMAVHTEGNVAYGHIRR